jgi:hypothetical protein
MPTSVAAAHDATSAVGLAAGIVCARADVAIKTMAAKSELRHGTLLGFIHLSLFTSGGSKEMASTRHSAAHPISLRRLGNVLIDHDLVPIRIVKGKARRAGAGFVGPGR